MPINFDDSKALAKLDKIKANMPMALKAAGMVVLTAAQQTIIEGGQDWTPWKRLPKHPHQMLWDTGTLIRSLMLGDTHNILRETDSSIIVGSNVAYSAAQQYGYAPHSLPARPFLLFNDAIAAQATIAYKKYLLQGVN